MTRTIEQIMADNRTEWLNMAIGWQNDQASAFRRMERAQRYNDADGFDDAAYDHADCHQRYLICMEMANRGEPVRGTLERQIYLETAPVDELAGSL